MQLADRKSDAYRHFFETVVSDCIEIGAGQGAVQGSDRIVGAALFHAGLALGLTRRDEAGRRLHGANDVSMRAWDGELAIGVGLRLTSTVKSKPPTRPSSRQSLTIVSKSMPVGVALPIRQAASRERL